MKTLFTIIPFVSSLVSFIFAIFVFKRYLARRRPYLLLWGSDAY